MPDDYVGTEEDKRLLLLASKFFVDELPPRPIDPPKGRRPRGDPEIRALATFVKALTRMSPNAQRAHIRWLAARFGVDRH